MFFKLMLVASVLILATSSDVNSLRWSRWDLSTLRLAFVKLDSLVRLKCVSRQLSDLDCLKKIEATQSAFPMANYRIDRLAANLLLYLNEFQTCNKKAVRLIDAALLGRPFAGPEHYEINKLGAKFRMDVLVGSVLVRAATKCKSYFEQWLRESERHVETRVVYGLRNLLTREVLNGQVSLDMILVDATLSDGSVGKQLISMQEDELIEFYSKYVKERIVKACVAYLRPMREMATVAKRLRLGKSTPGIGAHFDRPSVRLVDALNRVEMCANATVESDIYTYHHAKQASVRVLKSKEYLRKFVQFSGELD